MLQDRENILCELYPQRRKSKYFNTFFMNMLADNPLAVKHNGFHYEAVKR